MNPNTCPCCNSEMRPIILFSSTSYECPSCVLGYTPKILGDQEYPWSINEWQNADDSFSLVHTKEHIELIYRVINYQVVNLRPTHE